MARRAAKPIILDGKGLFKKTTIPFSPVLHAHLMETAKRRGMSLGSKTATAALIEPIEAGEVDNLPGQIS